MIPIRRTRLFGSSRDNNSHNSNSTSRARKTWPAPTVLQAVPLHAYPTSQAAPSPVPEAQLCVDFCDRFPHLQCPCGNVLLTDAEELAAWLPIARAISHADAVRRGGCILYTPPATGSGKAPAKMQCYYIALTDDEVYGRAAYDVPCELTREESTVFCDEAACNSCCDSDSEANDGFDGEESLMERSTCCCTTEGCPSCRSSRRPKSTTHSEFSVSVRFDYRGLQ